ncbi:hypothetical protein DSO57_1011272 [Entomophthora muscae]|uniref:Uncharacterized protein n=1 Tax=Entomophthora muscae TaxID=34485 RepID=A0ACC2TT85_9FUNG|nr:hypothetical protein DSO57_1011272 [Entomophthora muscae]
MLPFSEKVPKAFGVECEPIYAADSLATDQQKALAIYLFVAVCYTWSYPIFKGYHLQRLPCTWRVRCNPPELPEDPLARTWGVMNSDGLALN